MSSSLQLNDSLLLWRYWLYKAVLNFKLKYRGSRLGLLWPILSVLVVVMVIGTLWGILLSKESFADYYFYLLAGYPIWMIVSGSVQEGCASIKARMGGGVPFYTLILGRMSSLVIPFLTVLPLTLIIAVVMNVVSLEFALYVPLTLILLVAWGLGVMCLLLCVVAVFPDLGHFIKAIMRLAFLVTPIIWEVERLGEYQDYIWLNPFYLPLDACRRALMGELNSQILLYFCLYSLLVLLIGTLVLKVRINQIVK